MCNKMWWWECTARAVPKEIPEYLIGAQEKEVDDLLCLESEVVNRMSEFENTLVPVFWLSEKDTQTDAKLAYWPKQNSLIRIDWGVPYLSRTLKAMQKAIQPETALLYRRRRYIGVRYTGLWVVELQIDKLEGITSVEEFDGDLGDGYIELHPSPGLFEKMVREWPILGTWWALFAFREGVLKE